MSGGFDPFSWRGMKKHWAVIPIIATCGAACVLCGAYVTYMLTTKPDIVYNHKRLDRYDPPHNDVGPTDNRKLFRYQVPTVHKEVQALREDIYPQKQA